MLRRNRLIRKGPGHFFSVPFPLRPPGPGRGASLNRDAASKRLLALRQLARADINPSTGPVVGRRIGGAQSSGDERIRRPAPHAREPSYRNGLATTSVIPASRRAVSPLSRIGPR